MSRSYCTIVTALILAIAFSRAVSQDYKASLESLLPSNGTIEGWSTTDSARIYGGKDLYLFIDGGADLFLEYGFRQALAIEYQNVGRASINLEMYEMNDPGASYGIYSIRSGEEGTPMDIGRGGSAHAYYVMFWKGRYYVSIAASDSTPECREGLEALARAVDRKLSDEGQIPRIVESLPKVNLLKAGYFRGFLGLSSLQIFDLADMGHMVDGAFGDYGDHTILCMRYAGTTQARQRLDDISRVLKSNGRFKNYRVRNNITQVTDTRNRTLCFGQSGPHIIVSISVKQSVAIASFTRAVSLLRVR